MTLDDLERIAFGTVAVTAAALAAAAGPEVTFLAWRTLVVLGAADEPLRATELGQRLGTSKPSTSKLIRRLERRGLITLTSDPTDGRVVRVGLSARGSELRAAVVEHRRRILREAVDPPLPNALPEGLAEIARRLDRWT